MAYHINKLTHIAYSSELLPGFPLVIDDATLAYKLGITPKTLWWLVIQHNSLYDSFEIPKRGKSGSKMRSIDNPHRRLKNVQKVFLSRFLSKVEYGSHVGAYVPGRSCRHTAEQHVGHGVVISTDIQDFFPSVRESMIKKMFLAVGYNYKVASMMAALVTLDGCLPQGAPTSGAVANLVANWAFDQHVIKDLHQLDPRWVYTRYSDDIDLSHPSDPKDADISAAITIVRNRLLRSGFRLHSKKTCVEPRWKRQVILGMVVNEKINIPRKEYKRVRAILCNCLRHGTRTQFKAAGFNSAPELIGHLRGKVNYFKQVNKDKANELATSLEAVEKNDARGEDVFELCFGSNESTTPVYGDPNTTPCGV